MEFVIDATSLLLHSAGVKTYMHYWLRSLLEESRTSGDTVSTFPPKIPVASMPNHVDSAVGPMGTYWRMRLVNLCNLGGGPAVRYFAGKNLFHASQHLTSPPTRVKLTATIYDMSCWTHPETHRPGNVAATKHYAQRILKACDGLIAISEHARDTAVEILKIPPERIRVIYPGVPESFRSATDAEASLARSRFSLDKPYILFVGCIEPRKNVGGLLAAYLQLPDWVRKDADLVLAGPMGWESDEIKSSLAQQHEGIRYLGYVPEGDLAGLYRGASVLAYPSYYEGFGLPVAQAMASGIPVVCSDRSCLPEVVGGGGLLVDPDSVESLKHGLEAVLTSPDLARQLACRGKERATRYSWSFNAQRSLEFFREVCEK